MRSCKMPSGAEMPVFGIGTWRMGESARRRPQELEAVKYAIELGYPMIAIPEMYGAAAAEETGGAARQRPDRLQPGALLPVAAWPGVRSAAVDAQALDPLDGLLAARPGRPVGQAGAEEARGRGQLHAGPVGAGLGARSARRGDH